MSCENCEGFGGEIKTPRDLKHWLSRSNDLVKAGVMRYVGAGILGEPFQDIVKNGSWSGDFVSNYFSCSKCDKLFHLHAETYHGSGGALEQISHITEKMLNTEAAT